MSQGKARAMLQTAITQSRQKLLDDYDDMVEKNEAARERSFWGGLGGSILLPLIIGAATGGVGLLATSALAGIGSRVGAEALETKGFKKGEGVQEDFDTGTGFGSQTIGRELEQNIMDAYGGFDTKQWADAARASATTFIAGGGQKALKSAFAPSHGYVPAASGIGPPLQTPAVSPGIVQGTKNLLSAPYQFSPLDYLWGSYTSGDMGQVLREIKEDEG
tara:strand:+ start:122 stop:778 length:657 start_codon:yes stop_codon:yes gene_type:complete